MTVICRQGTRAWNSADFAVRSSSADLALLDRPYSRARGTAQIHWVSTRLTHGFRRPPVNAQDTGGEYVIPHAEKLGEQHSACIQSDPNTVHVLGRKSDGGR